MTSASTIRASNFDKENSSDVFNSAKKIAKNGGLGLGGVAKSTFKQQSESDAIINAQQSACPSIVSNDSCRTPIVKSSAKNQLFMNSIQRQQQRRALGDVINTTNNTKLNGNAMRSLVTPNSRAITHIPNLDSIKKSMKKMQLIDDTPIKNEMQYPEIEKFYPAPLDTFSDLFEESGGKLSTLMMKPGMPVIPSSYYYETNMEDIYQDSIMLDENEWQRHLKSMQKSLKKKSKFSNQNQYLDELKEVEMPSLDDLAFKIPDNF